MPASYGDIYSIESGAGLVGLGERSGSHKCGAGGLGSDNHTGLDLQHNRGEFRLDGDVHGRG